MVFLLSAGGVGIAWAWLSWPTRLPAETADSRELHATLETSTTVPPGSKPAPAASPQAPRSDSPLPATAHQLTDEVYGMVEDLVAAFPDNPDCLEMKARVSDWLGDSQGVWQFAPSAWN